MKPQRRNSRNPRQYTVNALIHFEKQGAYTSHLLEEQLHESGLSQIDRNLVTYIVSGTIKMLKRIDYVLNTYLRTTVNDLSPLIRNVLRMSVFQMHFMDRIPPYAIINEAVEIINNSHQSKLANLVNAVLRNVDSQPQKVSFPSPKKDLTRYLALFYSYPKWLVERWLDQFGEEMAEQICQYYNNVPQFFLRCNRLQVDRKTLMKGMLDFNIILKAGIYAPDSMEVLSPFHIGKHPYFNRGYFQVQDESAQLVVQLLQPKPGEEIVDACAAPGGKATYAAELMNNEGTVWALDISAERLTHIQENCSRLGLNNVFSLQTDFLDYEPDHPIDKLLLDVPCSNQGVLGKRADARWQKTQENLKQLLDLQKQFLEKAASIMAPNGVLVYSTCSIDKEENFGQIKHFLAKHPEFELEDAHPFFKEKVADSLVQDGCLATFPHIHAMDGAFAARLRKK